MRLRTLLDQAGLGLTVLVGAEALDRPIDRVFTATLRDPRRYLAGGELVLSGMEWWPRPEDSEAFVAALAEAGVAALGAGTAESGGPVPDHVVAACRRHEVPLFAVPEHISFATISEQVILGLAAERTPGVSVDRHRRLVTAVTGGLDALLAAGSAEMGADCWVLNAAGRVIAATGDGPDAVRMAGRFLRADKLPVVVAGKTVFPVESRKRAASWILVVDGDHRRWEPGRREVAAELATLAGLHRSRADEARRIENRAAAPLLRVLLAEHSTQAEIRSRLAATDLATAEAVVAVSASSAEVVDDLLSSFSGPALVGDVDGEIFGLLGAADPAAVVAGLKDMVRIIEPALSPAGFALGISVDTTNLRAAIQEARYARRLAESSAGRVVVMAGDEVASHQLLLAAVPDDLRRSFRSRVLGPVAAYDVAHKSELMRTLRVFLESSGSWAQAAAELHVHVNTLRYRIGRVEELTGRDLTRFADRVDLYLALGRTP